VTCPHCLSDPWLTPAQVSELLGFSEDWVLERALDGTLPSYEVPSATGLRIHRRFLLSDIEGWRASRKFSVEGNVVPLREVGG
jgi:predicted DNA-binding transcriptional regulator AlpA